MINKTQAQTLTVIFIFLVISLSCNYYQISRVKTGTAPEKIKMIDSLNYSNRYFILRAGNEDYSMSKIQASADQKTLTCYLDDIPDNHMAHVQKGYATDYKYKNANQGSDILNEVHFYIVKDTAARIGPYTLVLDNIQRIEVLQKDKKRTTNSNVLIGVGVFVGTLALAAAIAVATKSSCPFVSAYDGNQFSLQGEIYGGAIYRPLARHDYMPLRMSPLEDGSLQLKISNELKERQYTDIAELIVVTHQKNQRVLSNEEGRLFVITAPEQPNEVSLNTRVVSPASLQQSNDNLLLQMDDTTGLNATNDIVLKFPKSNATADGKLVLGVKNTYFLDLLYGELAQGFGKYYAMYARKQSRKSANELKRWAVQQKIPLEVSIKTTKGWTPVTAITTIGPLATRDIVIPLSLENTLPGELEIKLSSGFMFWELDFAGIDYSSIENPLVDKLQPTKATDETGKDVLTQLIGEDARYLEQPAIGNTATLVYYPKQQSDPNKTRSYILHSKGYYEHVRDFTNSPNISFLRDFEKPGYFAKYGLLRYKEIYYGTKPFLANKN